MHRPFFSFNFSPARLSPADFPLRTFHRVSCGVGKTRGLIRTTNLFSRMKIMLFLVSFAHRSRPEAAYVYGAERKYSKGKVWRQPGLTWWHGCDCLRLFFTFLPWKELGMLSQWQISGAYRFKKPIHNVWLAFGSSFRNKYSYFPGMLLLTVQGTLSTC